MVSSAYVIDNDSANLREIEISTEDFVYLKKYMTELNIFIAIEEKFIIAKDNFSQLHITILEVMNEYRLFKYNHIDLLLKRVTIIRAISNYLSSIGMYLDINKKLLPKMELGSNISIYNDYKELTHSVYDSNFGYRFCETLKNAVKHYGTPFSINFSENLITENRNFSHIITIDENLMANDRKLKPAIKREYLEKDDDKKEILDLFTQYMNGINKVNKIIEERYIEYKEDAKDRINQISEKYDFQNSFLYRIKGESDDVIINNSGEKTIDAYRARKELKDNLTGKYAFLLGFKADNQ